MRTKHLFMTMALAAGFAACTSEDVIETSYNNEASRTVLDNIEFTLGEVESRFTLESGKGWGFNEGDAFGAALVDVWSSRSTGSRGAIDKYLLQDAIQSNYQYAKGEGDVFTTPARMVEGNYVFYAPFNEKHLSRKPIEVITPISQTLDINEDGTVDTYSAVNNAVAEGNPFFLAYEFLPAVGQETKLSLDFYSIFAYPRVTIKNNKTTDVTLTKIVVKTDDKFIVKAPLKVGTTDATASANSTGVIGKLFNYGTYDKVKNPHGEWVLKNEDTEYNGLVGSTVDVLDKNNATAKADVIVLNLSDELTIEAGESVSFSIVMPAIPYTGAKVLAYVDDEEGYEISLSNAMTFYPNKLYPQQEYKNNNTLNENKKGSSFTATITKNAQTKPLANEFPILVASTDELKTAIIEGNSELYVIPTSDEVAIDESVVALMRQTKFQGMTIAGDIKIVGTKDATKPLELSENVLIEGTATIVSGYVQTHANVDFTAVEVEEGATFNVAALNKVYDAEEEGEVAKIWTVKNNGTVNVNVESSDVSVENFGTLNINKKNFAGTITEGSITNEETEVTTYYGTVNVKAANAIANTKLYSVWNFEADATFGAVSVYGTTTIADGAELEGTSMTIEGGATLNVNGELEGVVKLNSVADDEDTDENEEAAATLNLGETASLIDGFEAAEKNENTELNIVNVEDGASIFSMTGAAKYVTSKFIYEGNLTKAGDVADLIVPEFCNYLTIDGNLIPAAAADVIDLSGLSKEITTLYIDGDVRIKKDTKVKINTETLIVDGDVIVAAQSETSTVYDNLDLQDVENLKITGKFRLDENADLYGISFVNVELNDVYCEDGLDLTPATGLKKLVVTGLFETRGDIDTSSLTMDVVLKNAELRFAKGCDWNANETTLHIVGAVEMSGDGTKCVTNKGLKLYRDCVLTIDGVDFNRTWDGAMVKANAGTADYEGLVEGEKEGVVVTK